RGRARARGLVRDPVMPIVTLVVFAPLLGAVLLALLPREHEQGIRRAALAFAIVPFVLSFELLIRFRASIPDFQLVEAHRWIDAWGITYKVGVDGINLFLILLTTFLTPLVVLASFRDVHQRAKEYFVLFLVLETGMLGALVALDLFLFYVFWEVMLVPMYL